MPGFLQSLPCVHFPFADFALYPFAIINLIYDYDSTLSPLSFPSKSLNLREVLRGPSTNRKWKKYVICIGLSLAVNTTETKKESISYT